MKSFSDYIFEQCPQIACLIAHDPSTSSGQALHAADQTRLTDGDPHQAVPFGAQALPIEDAWKGFISHQNLGNFLATVRQPL